MNCTILDENGQEVREDFSGTIAIPSTLKYFRMDPENGTRISAGDPGKVFLHGSVVAREAETVCPRCRRRMHVNQRITTTIHHIPIGLRRLHVVVDHAQYKCPHCGRTRTQIVPFRHPRHRLTFELHTAIVFMLADGQTLKAVAAPTGVGRNIVKDIDRERLLKLYTEDGKLRKPDHYVRRLAIDEFKLHSGHRYATHVMDLDTGEVLFIAEGKSKQVVLDFINFVGLEWMSHVEAVSCDMNAGFCNAFTENCPHVKVVFDHFHVVKNFNEHLVAEVRKDEYRRLKTEGRHGEAARLKHSRYILSSSKATLEAGEDPKPVRQRTSAIFTLKEKPTPRADLKKRYEELLNENRLFHTMDTVKEHLESAYTQPSKEQMLADIRAIVEVCESTGNTHFAWFSRFLSDHVEGIVNHAVHRISSGRIEGTNNKIKTIRRQGYGYADTEYFFLKIMDTTRHRGQANPFL